MPGRNDERTALLVVDVLNPYEHEDADALAHSMAAAVEPIATLLERAGAVDVDVVYVNDNHGDWRSSHEQIAEVALAGRRPDVVEPLLPPDDASFVVKARHTVFYGTPLEYLLGQLGVRRLVLTGQVTEQCILYSALDAYVRHYDVVVPPDAVAHIHPQLAEAALEMMRRNMRVETPDARDCDL